MRQRHRYVPPLRKMFRHVILSHSAYTSMLRLPLMTMAYIHEPSIMILLPRNVTLSIAAYRCHQSGSTGRMLRATSVLPREQYDYTGVQGRAGGSYYKIGERWNYWASIFILQGNSLVKVLTIGCSSTCHRLLMISSASASIREICWQSLVYQHLKY